MTARLPPATGAAFFLEKGRALKVVDPLGGQVADFFCVSRADPREAFSAARSIDYAEKLRLTTGDALYSNRSAVMAVISEDTCGVHDLLMPPCSLRMYQLVAGDDAYHPSCHENLARAFAPHGVGPDEVATTFNLFMRVETAGGRLSIRPPLSRAGDFVVLEARMDLLVGLTACAHEESNGGALKPVAYELLAPGARPTPWLSVERRCRR